MQIEPLNTKEKVPSPRVTTHDKFVTTHDKSGRQEKNWNRAFSWPGDSGDADHETYCHLKKLVVTTHDKSVTTHEKLTAWFEILRLEIFYLCSKNFSDGWKLLVNTCNEEFHHPFPNLTCRFWRKIRSSIFVQSSLMISFSPLMKSTRYEKKSTAWLLFVWLVHF